MCVYSVSKKSMEKTSGGIKIFMIQLIKEIMGILVWNMEEILLENQEWLCCPICGNKTRNKVREDTVLVKFPLYCPKCKKECLIDFKNLKVKVIREADAQMRVH